METLIQPHIDVEDLRSKVRSMYTQVAAVPAAGFHFEVGEQLARMLGYREDELRDVPKESVESFAGVGYHFGLAGIKPGMRVLDLGSGSGMDVFIASRKVGSRGYVTGLDMTDGQLDKARVLAERDGFTNVEFLSGYLEDIPLSDATYDVVISNGVINLCADKQRVFREIARVLKPTGALAISDILTEQPLTEAIVCDTTLWASCIGGATQEDIYDAMLHEAGFRRIGLHTNQQYHFLSKAAQSASRKFGVKSVSLAARRI